MSAFTANIVAGIAVILLSTGAGFLYQWYLGPWLKEWWIKRRGALEIHGPWKLEGDFDGVIGKRDMDIRQRGRSIWGTATSTAGRDKGRVYLLKGTINNAILVCRYMDEERSSLDMGSFAVRLLCGGREMEGVCAFYSERHEAIHAAGIKGWKVSDKPTRAQRRRLKKS